jgi:cell division topological specificity factor MinE
VKFLLKLFGQALSETSAPRAKERLQLALTYDRNGLEQGMVEQLRGELSRVMAKHLAVKAEEIQIIIDHSAELDKLVASVPLRSARRPRGAAAASSAGAKTAAKTATGAKKVAKRR